MLMREPQDVIEIEEAPFRSNDPLLECEIKREKAENESQRVEKNVDRVANKAHRGAVHAVEELDKAKNDIEADELTKGSK